MTLIALDDGHGLETPGKRTPVLPDGTFMKENEFNSRVVELLDVHLKRCGFRTLLTAPGNVDTSLSARVKTANNAKADFFLSIHANALNGQWGTHGGIETLVFHKGESVRIGSIIHKNLLKGTQLRDRGMKDGSWLYIIKNTKMPAVLVECAFMDNLAEARLLMSEAYRQECAEELARALCEAFGKKYVEVSTTSAEAKKEEEKGDAEEMFNPSNQTMRDAVTAILLELADKEAHGKDAIDISWREKFVSGQLTVSDALALIFVAMQRGTFDKRDGQD